MIDVGAEALIFLVPFISFKPISNESGRKREREQRTYVCVWMTSVACTIFRAISRRTYTNALLASFYFPRFILQWVYLTKPHHTTHELFLFICALRISLSTDYTYKSFFVCGSIFCRTCMNYAPRHLGRSAVHRVGSWNFGRDLLCPWKEMTRGAKGALVRHRSLYWLWGENEKGMRSKERCSLQSFCTRGVF